MTEAGVEFANVSYASADGISILREIDLALAPGTTTAPPPGRKRSVMLEPWLRGTLTDVDPVRRQVLHAFELAAEDAERFCAKLGDEQMIAQPHGLASVCFHLRHIVRSLDRLLTYAEGRQLTTSQLDALAHELDCNATAAEAMREFRLGLERAATRVRAFDPSSYAEHRGVGRQRLPTTVAGLLIHCAEHTQRHIGQAITTAQVVTQSR